MGPARTSAKKSQTPSTKPGPRPGGGDSEGEITNKSQIPISNDQNKFGILVIVICLRFEICDLKFLVTPAYCRMRKRPLKPPLGVARSRVLPRTARPSKGPDTLLDKGFHLYFVAIGANGDGPVMVCTVGSCSQGVVAFQDLPGGQMERVVKADGKYHDSGLKPM